MEDSRCRLLAGAKSLIELRNSAFLEFSSGSVDATNFFAEKIQCPDDFSVMMLLDLDALDSTVDQLHNAFPDHFLHTFAAKANPIRKVLSALSKKGMGVECASRGELLQALASGTPPEKIVLDSPAKTLYEIELALKHGVSLNIDNLQELERVRGVVEAMKYDPATSKSIIGLRINPQIGGGALKGFSTGTSTSKFGIAIDDYKNEIQQAFANYPWLQMVHCHVGSQGCDFSLMTSGLRKIVNLALEMNTLLGKDQIQVIDIGGGLPVNFKSDQILPTFKQYADTLKCALPELFDGQFKVITEFGRAVIAKAGITIMQVEYTKQSGGKNFAVVQAGTDLFIRTIYHPDKWPLRATLLTKDGNLPSPIGNTLLYDIAGPCCLGMDVVAFDRELPVVHPEDYIILHDTASYFHASFSYYNSRCPPIFIGFRQQAETKNFNFELMCNIKRVEDSVAFYGE